MPRFPQPLPERRLGTGPHAGRPRRCSGRCRRHRRAFRRGRRLAQWPCQIKLVPAQAPYYQGRGLLIAADCTAFACASFHERFMSGNVTIIGCPKLDEGSYTDKLAAIIAANDITSVTVARMEVPCCGGLERAAAEACAQSGKDIPFEVITFAVNGDVID